mmetsp:Transcript_18472/g.32054  ORF Transcript_18472/g.32054 Transcript_18472/m.32054 type:complete len:127 (+) Transcript_18472:1170-1550(+)
MFLKTKQNSRFHILQPSSKTLQTLGFPETFKTFKTSNMNRFDSETVSTTEQSIAGSRNSTSSNSSSRKDRVKSKLAPAAMAAKMKDVVVLTFSATPATSSDEHQEPWNNAYYPNYGKVAFPFLRIC